MPREKGRVAKHGMREMCMCKATALQFLGSYEQASVNYEIALRMTECEDTDYWNLCEDMVCVLKDKNG